jgi:tetratricopeptide (TPR) repeat protein
MRVTFMTTAERAPTANNALGEAVTFLDEGRYDLAIERCSEAIRRDGANSSALQLRAIAHRAIGDDKRAASDFSAAVLLAPADAGLDLKETLRWETGDPVAFFNRGCAYHNERDYARAINNYSEAIKLDPSDVVAFLNRGIAFQTRDNNNPHKAGYDDRFGGAPDCDCAMRDYRAVLSRGSDATVRRIATERIDQLNAGARRPAGRRR